MNARISLRFILSSIGALLTVPCQTPAAFGGATPDADSLERGRQVYDAHCAACHGDDGDGQGPAAVWLYPKPRDFSSGLFKIQSTPGGSLPTDEDLFQTITRGMPGSSMPDFTYLTATQRRDVVEYVKHLTVGVDASGQPVNLFEAASRGDDRPGPVTVPPEPGITVGNLARGKELYLQMQCASCHGETGMGDGPLAPTLKDSWGLPLPPRDFNTQAFRGGHTGRDLYLRIHNGMAGTPMPPFGEDVMTPEDRWALVLYVLSLRRKDVEISDILQPPDGAIRASRIQSLPDDPVDPAWERWDVAWIRLNPLWPEPRTIPALSVRAVHDGSRLAILLQWRDPVANGAPVRVEDFQDAVALQFSMNGTAPFLGMGDANNPVNLWMWKAGWQQAVDGPRPDVETVHPSMHVDTYFETRVLYRTAEAAGNSQARSDLRSPVEDANARGFGTFRPQPSSGQNVDGRGVWRDGFWNVLVTRELDSPDADDVRLETGNPVPVAFAVWDGEQRARNGRKEISNWYQLVLEP